MNFHHKRSTCRLCESTKVDLVIPMQPIPAADGYVSAERLNIPQECYPVDLYLCRDCGHAQLLDVVDPSILFRDYIYVTSSSLGLVEHFRAYADAICRRYPFPDGSRMVEIGSNEGVLLRFFKDRGFSVLGVDPATQIAAKATSVGLETWPDFFTLKLAEKIRSERGAAAVVAANNVFAHSDHLAQMADGVRHLLQPDGIFVFEVNYLGDLVERKLFDIIYHEHISIHSAKPLKSFLERHGLQLIQVERIESKAGSLRCVAQLAGGPRRVDESVGKILSHEKELKLDQPDPFYALAAEMEQLRRKMDLLLADIRSQGKSVAAYGAAPASTTLIYYFGLQGLLPFIADDNPLKQGRFSPGCHVPVLASDVLLNRKPDYVIVLAWTYLKPILERNREFRARGGKFIVPLPDVQVL